ncbi:MAG: hypothetical protein R2764_03465 [Bacteroidales bacterium]
MTAKKSIDEKVTLYLIPHPGYVNPSVYIKILDGKRIRFADITTDKVKSLDSADKKEGYQTTIWYVSTDEDTSELVFHDASHDLPGLPHEVNIEFTGSGGVSTVKDVILPD